MRYFGHTSPLARFMVWAVCRYGKSFVRICLAFVLVSDLSTGTLPEHANNLGIHGFSGWGWGWIGKPKTGPVWGIYIQCRPHKSLAGAGLVWFYVHGDFPRRARIRPLTQGVEIMHLIIFRAKNGHAVDGGGDIYEIPVIAGNRGAAMRIALALVGFRRSEVIVCCQ